MRWLSLNTFTLGLFFLFSFLLSDYSVRAQVAGDALYKRGATDLENTYPPSPEPSSAVKYADLPMSYCEGLADLGVPIYTMSGRELNIDLSFRYRSGGIRLDEIGGVAGLGWTLEAGGCITRTVVDMPDEFESVYMTHGMPSGSLLADLESMTENTSGNAFLRDVLWHYRDVSLDRYSYSFCGLSGTFVILDDGSVFHLSGPGVEIVPQTDETSQGISSFTVRGPDGTVYMFGDKESTRHCGSSESQITPGIGQADEWTATTAWHLSSITSASGCETATFNYTDGDIWKRDICPLTETAAFTQSGLNGYSQTFSNQSNYISSRYTVRFLSSVTISGYTAVFTYSSDTGNHYHTGGDGWSSSQNCPRRLTRVDISYDNNLLQRVEVGTEKDLYDGRIILGSLRYYRGGELDDKWNFSYATRTSTVSRYSRDWYGYYNSECEDGGSSRNRICPFTVNQSYGTLQLSYGIPNGSAATYMSLIRIDHDKAVTTIEYEGSEITSQGQTAPVGIRVKRIAVQEDRFSVLNRTFTYENGVCIGPFIPLSDYYTDVSCTQSLEYSSGGLPTGVVYTWGFSVHESSVTGGPGIEASRILYGRVTEDVTSGSLLSAGGPRTVYTFSTGGVRLSSVSTISRFPGTWYDKYNAASQAGSAPIHPWTGVRSGYDESGPDSPALLIKKETYAWEGSGHTLVESEDYSYDTPRRRSVLLDYKVTQVMQRYQSGDLRYSDMYHYPVYGHDSPGNVPVKTVCVCYHPGGNDTTTVRGVYHGRGNLSAPPRLSSVTHDNGDRIRLVRYTYPDTWTDGPTWATSLKQAHVLSVPLKTTYGYVDSSYNGNIPYQPLFVPIIVEPVIIQDGPVLYETDREYGWYEIGGAQRLMPHRTIEFTDGLESWSEEILSRDTWGNPSSVKTKGHPITFVEWGLNGLYPLTITEGTGADAHINTYTWLPGIGLTSETTPSGVTTSYEYDGAGRLTAVKDESGRTIESYEYHLMADASGRRSRRQRTYRDASGTICSESVLWWNELGLLKEAISIGRSGTGSDLVTASDRDYLLHDDARTWLPYPADTDGGLFQANASAAAATYHSNALAYVMKAYEESSRDRVQRTALPGYAGSHEDVHDTRVNPSFPLLEWDETDNTVVQNGTWPQWSVRDDYTVDADGRRKSVLTDGVGRTLGTTSDVRYVYDRHDRLRAVAPGGTVLTDTLNMWRYRYDSIGRLNAKALPGCTDAMRFSYDTEDRIISVADGDGTREMEYDVHGRIVRLYHNSTAAGSVRELIEEHSYDSELPAATALFVQAGEPVSWSGPVTGLETGNRMALIGTEGSVEGYINSVIRYDNRARKSVQVSLYPDGGIHKTNYEYDFSGEVIREVESYTCGSSSDVLEHRYTFDNWERLVSSVSTLSTGGGNVVSRDSTVYSYDALGRLGSRVSYSGVSPTLTTTDTYTLQGWLQERTVSTSGSGVIYSESLDYDSVTGLSGITPSYTGKITKKTQTIASSSAGATSTRYEGYAYDSLARLSRVVPSLGGAAVYNTDRRGNVQSIVHYRPNGSQLFSEEFAYGGDRLTSLTNLTHPDGVQFQYDAMGRMVTDGLSGTEINYNRIGKAQKVISGGSTLVKFSYLADGTLESAADAGGEGLVYRGSLIYRRGSNGTLNLESASFGAGRLTPSGVRYHVTDHLGSVMAVVDGTTGDVLESGIYGVYGARTALVANTGTTSGTRQRFTGKEDMGVAFGVPYTDFGARHYAPAIGRWTTLDPLSEDYYPTSPYVYCNGDPVNLVDMDGMLYTDYFDSSGNYLINDGIDNGIIKITVTDVLKASDDLFSTMNDISYLNDNSVTFHGAFSYGIINEQAALKIYNYYNRTGLPLVSDNSLLGYLATNNQGKNNSVRILVNINRCLTANKEGFTLDNYHDIHNALNIHEGLGHYKKYKDLGYEDYHKKPSELRELEAIKTQIKDSSWKQTTSGFREGVFKYYQINKNKISKRNDKVD